MGLISLEGELWPARFVAAGARGVPVLMLGGLESVTGARIHVQVQLPERPCHVRVDASQFETALINIALNARDAMDGQGTLTLRVATVDTMPRIRGDEESRQPFVSIALADTDCSLAGLRVVLEILLAAQRARENGELEQYVGPRVMEGLIMAGLGLTAHASTRVRPDD